MARVRSPNYPNISLPVALERIRKLHTEEARNDVDRESVAQILGYSGLSGPASKMLSSLSKYGFVEKAGSGEIRISERAIEALFGEPDMKEKALKDAASSPQLFAEINEKWPQHQPSDENLRNYLARKGFSSKVLNLVIAAYRDTMSLVSDESGDYDSPSSNDKTSQGQIETQQQPAPPPIGKMRVALTDDHLEVAANLLDSESVDRLIQVLTANKALLPNKPAALDPMIAVEDDEDDEEWDDD